MTDAISIDGLTMHYKGVQALTELTVQRAITLFAVDVGLTLVFLRLVHQKEVAA